MDLTTCILALTIGIALGLSIMGLIVGTKLSKGITIVVQQATPPAPTPDNLELVGQMQTKLDEAIKQDLESSGKLSQMMTQISDFMTGGETNANR